MKGIYSSKCCLISICPKSWEFHFIWWVICLIPFFLFFFLSRCFALPDREPECSSFVIVESYSQIYLKSNNIDIFLFSFSFYYTILLVFLNYITNHHSHPDGNSHHMNHESKASLILCILIISPNIAESHYLGILFPYFISIFEPWYEVMNK